MFFRSIFGGKTESDAESKMPGAEEEAKPYWIQAANQKSFMEAYRTQLGSSAELQAMQMAVYDDLIEKSKQAGETPGAHTPHRSDDSTFEGLPRITMKDLDARSQRLATKKEGIASSRDRGFQSESHSYVDEQYISSHDIHHPE